MRASTTSKPGMSDVTRKAVTLVSLLPGTGKARHHRQNLGNPPVGDVVLLAAVEDPALAVRSGRGAGLHISGVGTGLFFRQREGGQLRAVDQTGQPALLLLRSACQITRVRRMPMLWWALTNTAVDEQWPPITSMILQLPCCEKPRPPTSLGADMPSTPRRAKPKMFSRGMSALRSIAAASSFSSQYLRTSRTAAVDNLAFFGFEDRVRKDQPSIELAKEKGLGKA